MQTVLAGALTLDLASRSGRSRLPPQRNGPKVALQHRDASRFSESDDHLTDWYFWYRLPGLNGGPLDPQSSALTN